jgi:hypothetical protein
MLRLLHYCYANPSLGLHIGNYLEWHELYFVKVKLSTLALNASRIFSPIPTTYATYLNVRDGMVYLRTTPPDGWFQ